MPIKERLRIKEIREKNLCCRRYTQSESHCDYVSLKLQLIPLYVRQAYTLHYYSQTLIPYLSVDLFALKIR
jgi:hypothetical protein